MSRGAQEPSMALSDDFQEFAAVPPVLLNSAHSTTQHTVGTGGAGASLFHEIGGNVFEIPPLPDDLDDFSLSPSDAAKTTLPTSLSPPSDVFDPPLPLDDALSADSPLPPPLADSPLPPPLTDSSLPPPLTNSSLPLPPLADSSTRDDGFTDFTMSTSVDPISLPPPLPAIDDSSLSPSADIVSSSSSGSATALSKSPAQSSVVTGAGPLHERDGSDVGDSKPNTSSDSWGDWSGVGGGGGGGGGGDGFADFSGFQSSSTDPAPVSMATPTVTSTTTTTTTLGNAISAPGVAHTNASNLSDSDTGFAEFTSWNTASIPQQSSDDLFPPSSSQTTSQVNTVLEDDEFGEFGSFADHVSSASTVVPPVSSGSVTGAAFGEFTESTQAAVLSAKPTEKVEFNAFSGGGVSGEDDFGAFSNASSSAPAVTSSSAATDKNDEFGNFHGTNGDDEFGEFGAFSAPPPLATSTSSAKNVSRAETTTSSMGTRTSSQPSHSKIPKDVMLTCFPSVTMDTVVGVASDSMLHIAQYLQSSTHTSHRVWSSLATESASTSLLYQWRQSLLQDHFYTALSVDPMLAPATTTTSQIPVYSRQLSDGLLSPGAGTGLLEGFGFESTAKAEPQLKIESEETTFGWDGSVSTTGATLLDLSLPPSSPPPQTEQGVLLDSDLLGLDLTSAPIPSQPATSNHDPLSTTDVPFSSSSSWMDAQLLELGMGEATGSTDRVQPLATLTGPQQANLTNLDEQLQQLGLDASKTTWRQKTAEGLSSQQELSKGARTLLQRLPDLSFLLSEPAIQT